MYTDLRRLDHDKETAIALGNLVIAWAYAEGALLSTLARVTDININMALMSYYRIPTFEARTKFIQALILEWKPGKYDKEAISKEVHGINGLASARNHWVHGVWCKHKEMTETVIFDFRAAEDKGRRSP